MADTALMPIPGQFDPVPTPREVTPRADGRVDLIGLPRQRIAELFEAAGLDSKAARLRSRQVFHWLYHRGVTGFDGMTDIAGAVRDRPPRDRRGPAFERRHPQVAAQDR
jgi:23S rRNA (adenine2503-C2)-methyltransferase